MGDVRDSGEEMITRTWKNDLVDYRAKDFSFKGQKVTAHVVYTCGIK